jgi:ATP-dependent Clp protease adaptor protein ClpS
MPQSPTPRGSDTAVLPREETEAKEKVRRAPLYHVILHDDDKHTYQYVVVMLMRLFGMTAEEGYQHARRVDTTGRTIVATTTLERAELKRDQIRAFGPDPLIPDSPGSMAASIEKAE